MTSARGEVRPGRAGCREIEEMEAMETEVFT